VRDRFRAEEMAAKISDLYMEILNRKKCAQ
jgi:hypothetical protein